MVVITQSQAGLVLNSSLVRSRKLKNLMIRDHCNYSQGFRNVGEAKAGRQTKSEEEHLENDIANQFVLH